MQKHITQYRMQALCEVLCVSRSGFRAWLHRPVNAYKLAFKGAVSASYHSHKTRAGAPSIAAEIKVKGFNKTVLLVLYSRQVVGWQMSTRIDRKLVCDPLQAAILTRGKPEGMMVHSDQGVQYASKDYRALIMQYQLTQSMSRHGNCWDNALAESFFATLNKQAVYVERFLTRQKAQQHIFEYIECYYNRMRRHSTNCWLSPVDYETAYYNEIKGMPVH